jgi:hypothetical protein
VKDIGIEGYVWPIYLDRIDYPTERPRDTPPAHFGQSRELKALKRRNHRQRKGQRK